MTGRISLFLVQLALLALGAAGAALGPAWDGPAVPEDVAPHIAASMVLDRKELHLANAWHAIDRGAEPKRAVFHARAALAEGPASGYGWLALAWAEHLSGHTDAALDALARSWRWAPHSRNLALRRVVLGAAHWPRLTPEGRARLVAEMRLARQADMGLFHRLIAEDRGAAAIWRIARGRGLDRSAFATDISDGSASPERRIR